MKKALVSSLGLLGVALLATQCKLENTVDAGAAAPTLPEQAYDYSHFTMPKGNGGPVIDFPTNGGTVAFNAANPQITDHGATLGRVLFYDTKLSINNAVACASCHKQELAFSDEKAGSTGFGGAVTSRNSMAIVNAGLNNNLFWDSRSSSVMDLVSRPIQNHIEMGMESMDQLARKLGQVSYYGDLFEKAFGSRDVTEKGIESALAQFVSAMVSSNSKWDQGFNNAQSNFTAQEKLGMAVFFNKGKCAQCHAGANFAAPDGQFEDYGGPTIRGTANNGLDTDYRDNGKGDGQFRIPSLRNIALTGPYMHDGRFTNLMEVVEHYNSGIQPHVNLDPKLRDFNGQPQKLGLTQDEKEGLVAFLNTLTDNSITGDVRFESPFKK